MDEQELGFNAWILIGNALLNAVCGEALSRLDAQLRNVTPEKMLAAIRALPQDDRLLLADLCRTSFDRAGADASSLLGMERDAAAPVIALLREP